MHILKCILLLHFIDNLDRHRCLVWNTFSLEFWRYYTIAFLLLVLLLRSQKSVWFLTPFYYMGALRRFSLSAVCWKFTVIRFLWVPFNLEICILPLSPRLPLHPSKFSWIILLVISSFIFCVFPLWKLFYLVLNFLGWSFSFISPHPPIFIYLFLFALLSGRNFIFQPFSGCFIVSGIIVLKFVRALLVLW